MNNCRIYEDDSKARSAHYKGLSEIRGKKKMNRGSLIVLKLIKVNRELLMIRGKVGEVLLLLLSAIDVVSWVIVLVNARVI